ncbi:MAG TPA: S8 family serine peptidase [Steroidobacteraceae bacterium]|nr:S8 family serine peptidase [Steroidobacteraceae bacterium]
MRRFAIALPVALALSASVTHRADSADAWRSRVVARLLQAYDAPASAQPANAAASPFEARFDAAGRVQMDVHYACAAAAPARALTDAGLSIGSSVRLGNFCVVEGWANPAALARIAALPEVTQVRVPQYVLRDHPPPMKSAEIEAAIARRTIKGQVRAQASSGTGIDANGVSIMRADQFVAQTGASGQGITVGVQSGGVSNISTITTRHELPTVRVLALNDGAQSPAGDEGTALLEEVHAVAPGAALAFCGPGTFVEFTSCLGQLVAAGATVLADDLIFPPTDLMSLNGTDQQAITAFLQQNPNVLMFTAAGNFNGSYWEGPYAAVSAASVGVNNLSCVSSGGQVDHYLATFGSPSNYSQLLTVLQGSSFPMEFAWADPPGQNVSNFDVYWTNITDPTQTGCFPTAIVNGSILTPYLSLPQGIYTIYVATPDTTLQGKLIKLLFAGDGLTSLSIPSSGSIGSAQGLANGVVTVGAVNGSDGVGNGIESFSTVGPLSVAFPSPAQIQAPLLVAPDGINVDAVGTYFQSALFPDGNFYGTSASVPNAAAVGALLRSAFPAFSPAQILTALQDGAAPLGNGIPNATFGYGRVDALGALATVPLPTISALQDATVVGGSSTTPIAFTVSGTGALHFAVVSSVPAIVPSSIAAAGSPGVTVTPSNCGTGTMSCMLYVTPALGHSGTANLTFSVLDGASRGASATMSVTVTTPDGPTLTINSGADQRFTAGTGSASPVAFTLTGAGVVTVHASSSNLSLVSTNELAVSSGCGTSTQSCTLSISTASGASGSATITLTATDAWGQAASGTIALQVDPGASTSGGSGTGATGGGGGGALEWWTLGALCTLALRRGTRRERVQR